MTDLKALIFDVDGTLADTEQDGHRVAFNSAFTEAGLKWHWDVALYGDLLRVTGGKERIRFFIENYQPDYPHDGALDAFITDLHRLKTAHFVALLERGALPLRPGVERLLREARDESLRLAIATTTTVENVMVLLEQNLGAAAPAWFEVIAAGDVVPHKKPAPDIYLLALEQMGLAADECLAIEDSINGLRASLDSGIATLITVNDYTRTQDFSGASAVIDHLGEPGHTASWIQGLPASQGIVDVAYLRELFKQQQAA